MEELNLLTSVDRYREWLLTDHPKNEYRRTLKLFLDRVELHEISRLHTHEHLEHLGEECVDSDPDIEARLRRLGEKYE